MDAQRIANVVSRVNARRRRFGLFGGLSWLAIVQIVMQIVQALLNREGGEGGRLTLSPMEQDVYEEFRNEYGGGF